MTFALFETHQGPNHPPTLNKSGLLGQDANTAINYFRHIKMRSIHSSKLLSGVMYKGFDLKFLIKKGGMIIQRPQTHSFHSKQFSSLFSPHEL